jgi:hypothetical protein
MGKSGNFRPDLDSHRKNKHFSYWTFFTPATPSSLKLPPKTFKKFQGSQLFFFSNFLNTNIVDQGEGKPKKNRRPAKKITRKTAVF